VRKAADVRDVVWAVVAELFVAVASYSYADLAPTVRLRHLTW
jgi:hypothetical protein